MRVIKQRLNFWVPIQQRSSFILTQPTTYLWPHSGIPRCITWSFNGPPWPSSLDEGGPGARQATTKNSHHAAGKGGEVVFSFTMGRYVVLKGTNMILIVLQEIESTSKTPEFVGGRFVFMYLDPPFCCFICTLSYPFGIPLRVQVYC